MTQTIDLSYAGVDRILAALAAEGIEVHYSETDGDTAIDIWLTDVELADGMPATALSWRDTEGWLLRHWDEFRGDTNTQTPDRKWPVAAGGPAEVARDVAAILAESAERPDLTAVTAVTRQLLAAGWVYDSATPMTDGTTERVLLHPSGRQITAMTAADGTTDLTMTGLTLEQVADAVTAAGLTGQSAAPTEVDALVDGITTLLDGPGGSTVGAEHAHVGGVIGGPGENEAECACGLIFGGFDSQAAALEFLDRHIADPEKTPEPTLQQRLAAELHRIADDIVRLGLPLGGLMSASLRVGVLDNRADLERWASYLGSEITTGSNNIPAVNHKIALGDPGDLTDLTVGAQTHPAGPTEVERLRARVAELEAQQSTGGAA